MTDSYIISYIIYRKIQTVESVEITVQAGKYLLHKLMIGKNRRCGRSNG